MSSIWKKLQSADSITPALRDEIICEYGVRGKKALDALIGGNVRKYLDFFVVTGTSGEYVVEDDFCTCSGFCFRKGECSHIIAVRIAIAMNWYETVPFWYQDRLACE